MKRTLLPVLALGILLLSACSAPAETQVIHYVNKDFGFSVDYPKGWILEEINPNEIGIKPTDNDYNQIQIGADYTEPVIGSMPEQWVADVNEAGLQQFWDMRGGSNLNIIINEPTTGKWDWVVTFTVIYEGTPLQGSFLAKETPSILYTATIIQCMDWPEGQEVINSFKLIE